MGVMLNSAGDEGEQIACAFAGAPHFTDAALHSKYDLHILVLNQ